ncbi:probable lipid phosphate phosphatase beta isoform X3 [Helianthus annuus]|uniref:probable lipid phosphate phosphatase beta isoform X3 n=1 Tax=Helianthus annuus TaxID=4232 RepID=UPI000B90776E|nr:probable lipid phosphate phosphatase beta isoform X3 [Helianthus annuus]
MGLDILNPKITVCNHRLYGQSEQSAMDSPQPPPPPPLPPSSLLHNLITFDTKLSLSIYTLTQPIFPRFFLKLLEISGDGRLFFPIILSVLLSPLPSTSPILFTVLVNLLIGSVLDLIIIGTVKHLVRRHRPVYNKHMFLTFAVDHWSFPSGHASRVCFIASVIYFSSDLVSDILGQLEVDLVGFGGYESVRWLNFGVVGWACATSVSRVLLGRHFVFDVAAGAGLGVLNALFVVNVLNYL